MSLDKKIEKLDFPYIKYTYPFNKSKIKKLAKDFKPKIYDYIPNNLKNKDFEKLTESSNGKNKYFIIVDKWQDNEYLNSLTDYFSEKVRVKCKFGKGEAPIDLWNKNKKKWLLKTFKKYHKINFKLLRETLYFSMKFCNNFRISILLALLKSFKPKSWLDISCGWGDRLLSALLYGIDTYVSADPNRDLYPCYQEMIDTFGTATQKKNFYIYHGGFEQLDLKNQMFDIVLSSPPFFKMELYSTYENNSVTKYSEQDAWIKHFLIPSLEKCCIHLKEGGYMILYLYGIDWFDGIMQFLTKHLKFLGIITYYDTKGRGFHLFQKGT